MARTTSTVNRSKQTKVTTAAKRARVEEAGLGGRRTGKSSATTKVVQAKRDTRQAKAAELEKSTAKLKSPKVVGLDPVASTNKTPAAKGTKAPGKKARTNSRLTRSGPLIEIRTGNNIAGSAKLNAYAESVVTEGLSRFSARLTRIDVYLSDVNADKKGSDDKHCQIEARPASTAPLSATASAASNEKALTLAVGKMKRLLATHFDKRGRR